MSATPPRCHACGYDLSASGKEMAWRCPECGALPVCRACGYDLAGLIGGPVERCPDCGTPFNPGTVGRLAPWPRGLVCLCWVCWPFWAVMVVAFPLLLKMPPGSAGIGVVLVMALLGVMTYVPAARLARRHAPERDRDWLTRRWWLRGFAVDFLVLWGLYLLALIVGL